MHIESNASVEGEYIKTKSSSISSPGPRQIPDVGIDLSSIDRLVGANHISTVHYLSIVSHGSLTLSLFQIVERLALTGLEDGERRGSGDDP